MDKRHMTPKQLAAIRARCERAQWTLKPSSDISTCESISDIPALLDHIERLQAKVDGLESALGEAIDRL